MRCQTIPTAGTPSLLKSPATCSVPEVPRPGRTELTGHAAQQSGRWPRRIRSRCSIGHVPRRRAPIDCSVRIARPGPARGSRRRAGGASGAAAPPIGRALGDGSGRRASDAIGRTRMRLLVVQLVLEPRVMCPAGEGRTSLMSVSSPRDGRAFDPERLRRRGLRRRDGDAYGRTDDVGAEAWCRADRMPSRERWVPCSCLSGRRCSALLRATLR